MNGPAAFMRSATALHQFQDDAFYYLQTARHVASGDGFTFDGVHATNGFHPLWLFILVAVVRCCPGDILPVRVVLLLQCLLIGAAAARLATALRPRLGGAAATATSLVVLALPGTGLILACGMESALLLFLVVQIISRWLALKDNEDAPAGAWVSLGIWCALAFLARLEAGLITLAILLVEHRRWRKDRRRLSAFVATPIVVASAYFAWNRITFGLWLPISGIVKMRHGLDNPVPLTFVEKAFLSFQPLFGVANSPRDHYVWPAVYATAILAALLAVVIFHRPLWRRITQRRLGGPMIICIVLWLAENVAPSPAPWYPVAMLLMTALLSGILLTTQPRLSVVVAAGLAIMGLGRGVLHLVRDPREHQEDRLFDAIEWSRKNIPQNELVGSWDAGRYAWLTHLKVVNLDGLVNDRDYYSQVIVGHDLKGYVDSECISWFAELADPRQMQRPHVGFTAEQTVSIRVRLVHNTRLADSLSLGIWHVEDPDRCRRRETGGRADSDFTEPPPLSWTSGISACPRSAFSRSRVHPLSDLLWLRWRSAYHRGRVPAQRRAPQIRLPVPASAEPTPC